MSNVLCGHCGAYIPSTTAGTMMCPCLKLEVPCVPIVTCTSGSTTYTVVEDSELVELRRLAEIGRRVEAFPNRHSIDHMDDGSWRVIWLADDGHIYSVIRDTAEAALQAAELEGKEDA